MSLQDDGQALLENEVAVKHDTQAAVLVEVQEKIVSPQAGQPVKHEGSGLSGTETEQTAQEPAATEQEAAVKDELGSSEKLGEVEHAEGEVADVKQEATAKDEAMAEPEVTGLKREREGDVDTEQAAKRFAAPAPVRLGYKTFKSCTDCKSYFQHLVHSAMPGQQLNEYELSAVLDLLRKGHPRADEKLQKGVKAVEVGTFKKDARDQPTMCFYIVRLDGSKEDFSYNKCLEHLYPDNLNELKLFSKRLPQARRAAPRGRGFRGRGRGGRGHRGKY